MIGRRFKWALFLSGGCIVVLLLLLFGWKSSRKHLEFDPAELAARETRMWQAYYDGQPDRVALELVAVLREQFGMSYAVSLLTARDLAEAARLFRNNQTGHETVVLPHIERAYARICRAIRADWDAHEVAQAELAWWTVRRGAGGWDNARVGRAIAHLYELLYDIDPARAERAGQLRAEAAQIRTIGAYSSGVDWPRVQQLLTDSYRELRAAIDERRPTG